MLSAIAARHRRTPAQVALRYQLQRGVVALAKSFNEERIRENFQVHGRAVGGRGLMEAPRLPLLWVIGEAPKVYLGQARLLAYAMHASAVSNYPPPPPSAAGRERGSGKETQKVNFGSQSCFFTQQCGLDFFSCRMKEL